MTQSTQRKCYNKIKDKKSIDADEMVTYEKTSDELHVWDLKKIC